MSPPSPVGLTAEEARQRLQRYGANRLPEPPAKNPLLELLAQLASPLVLTLLGAAVIGIVVAITSSTEASFLVRFGDAIAIVAIVVLNAILGFAQERRAQSALAALRRFEVPSTRVWRDGQLVRLMSTELVPGDF